MRPCLVMGSGRSGTSLVSGCLHGGGYWMGDDLIEATPGNPKGYFESRTVERLNEELLLQRFPMRPKGITRLFFPSRMGKSQRWLARMPVDDTLDTPRELLARMRSCIRAEPFALKDPRFCYTLPCWRPLLPSNIAFVCVFRRPEHTVASMLKEWKREPYLRTLRFSRAWALQTWTLCYRHILENHASKGDWLFLHYDQMMKDSGLERIERFLETRIDRAFPDRALSHHQDIKPMAQPQRTVYEALCIRAGYSDEHNVA